MFSRSFYCPVYFAPVYFAVGGGSAPVVTRHRHGGRAWAVGRAAKAWTI